MDQSVVTVFGGSGFLGRHLVKRLADAGLVQGHTLGIDATTLEANAALRSIVRHDIGDSYEEYLNTLAKASVVETPTRKDRAKIDKKRPKKGSNQDWSTRRTRMLESPK